MENYNTYGLNREETLCYIFEGGIIIPDESGLIGLIGAD